jgi:imidazolonepropionase-like amidohydrolase
MKLIKGVTIYTMNEQNDVIDSGDILIENGKIVQFGKNLSAPQEAEVIEGNGAIVTPGLIDIHTHVGIWGETTGDTSDGNEASSPFTPLMLAIDAINPQHISFDDARSGGVTTVQTGAGSGNPIGGIWTIIKTVGTTIDEMIVRERSGLKGALGENPKGLYGVRQKKSPYTRMSTANWIRDGFIRAKKALADGQATLDELYARNEQDLLPFIEVLEGKLPFRLHAHRADDIATAIRIAKEFDLDLSIEHCTEGFKIASYIKESGYPVTIGPFMGAATKYETRDMNLENPKILQEQGALVAIITDHPFVPIQYLSICAAEAVKYGMNEMEALRAITIHPALIGGVADRVGSIEKGKDADLVVWSDHPFKTKARVLSTWIEGNVVYSG